MQPVEVRKLDTSAPPQDLLAEVGRTGLRHWNGYLDQEWQTELKGKAGARMYREMQDNEPIIGMFLFVTEMMLRRVPVKAKAKNEAPLAKEIAAHVNSCVGDILEDGGWGGVMSNALSMLPFGWSWLEKVYKYRRGIDNPLPEFRSKHNDGRIGWRKLPIRGQTTLLKWHLGGHGELLGWDQQAAPDYRTITITRAKGLHFRLRPQMGNPEGYAVLRPIYQPYYFAKHARISEAIGSHRNLAGLPDMQIPERFMNPNATTADKATRAAYEAMVRQMFWGERSGIVRPSELDSQGKPTGYKFSLVSASGRSNSEIDTTIKRYESRMAMALMVQFLLLGQDKVGSYSLSSDQTDLFAVALGAILDVIMEEFNLNAIPELVKLNGWPVELAPELGYADIEKQDVAKLMGALATAVGSSIIIPDRALENWSRELLGAPEAETSSARMSQSTTSFAEPTAPAAAANADAELGLGAGGGAA